MQGKCEVLEEELCTGCEGCMYNLDILKLECETYLKYKNTGYYYFKLQNKKKGN